MKQLKVLVPFAGLNKDEIISCPNERAEALLKAKVVEEVTVTPAKSEVVTEAEPTEEVKPTKSKAK